MSPPNLVRVGWFRSFVDFHSNIVALLLAVRDGEIVPEIALDFLCSPKQSRAKS
jgi:hypothetical protein